MKRLAGLFFAGVLALCIVDSAAQTPSPRTTLPSGIVRNAPRLSPPQAPYQDRAIHPPGTENARRIVPNLETTTPAGRVTAAVRARTQRALLCEPPLEVAPQGGFRTLENTQFPCLAWRNVVAWIERDGARTPYDQWPPARKARLEQLFRAILTEEPDLGIACPANPVNDTMLSPRTAEDLYLVHVAHALVLESQRRVPWRLWSLPTAELPVILAPEYHVLRVGGVGAQGYYRLPFPQDSARAFDCDPRVGFRFMTRLLQGRAAPLLGATEEDTLIRLSAWFRDEVGHGGYSYDELAQHAHLADRLVRYRSFSPPPLVAYWAVMGCHNAAQTFADLARSVNIPLLRVSRGDRPGAAGGHAGLVFRWAREDTRVLQHADDIYAMTYVIFPITADGRAIGRHEEDRVFFDTNWPTPETLRDRGFEYALTQLAPAPGSIWHGAIDTLGWSIGAWRRGESATRGDYEVEYQNALLKRFDIGDQDTMKSFCEPGRGTNVVAWDNYIADSGGRPTSRPITGAEFTARIATMVNAHGGCIAVMQKINDAKAYKLRPL